MTQPLILLTNDDGIASPGLAAAAAALAPLGELLIVAPDVQQTSMGRSRTQQGGMDGRLFPATVRYGDLSWPGVSAHAMCLDAGKNVLCEKAFTINAGEAERLVARARSANRFLMEAMWTRFFPIHVCIREMLAAGRIGDVHGVVINFIAKPPFDLKNRFFDLNLGAGVLLDTGSYGVSWAYSLFGAPEQVTGLAYFGESGADYRSSVLMKFPAGQLATITCCQVSYDVKEAVIYGSRGKIEIDDPWYKPFAMTVSEEGKTPERIDMPLGPYTGYEYEAFAVMDCIAAGKTECEVMPLDETLSIMHTLDGVRAQWGFKYPFEH